VSSLIKCSICGKICDFWIRSLKDYTYKVRYNTRLRVQCSYTCWGKELERKEENDRNKRKSNRV